MKLKRRKKLVSLPDLLGAEYDAGKAEVARCEGLLKEVKTSITDLARRDGVSRGKRTTARGETYEVGFVTITKTTFNEAKLLKAVGRKLFDAMRRPVTTYVFDQVQIKTLVSQGKVKTLDLKNCLVVENSERIYVKKIKGGTEDEAQEEISNLFGS